MNNKLLSAPDLLRNLVGIVFRFRDYQIAITADVESLFSQVAAPREESRVLDFLWAINQIKWWDFLSTIGMCLD